MDHGQQTTHNSGSDGHCRLKLVDFQVHENHTSHETEGLSQKHLVLRRGKPFRVTLLFRDQSWNPHAENLVLQVVLGHLSQKILVRFADKLPSLYHWSATVLAGHVDLMAVTINVCSPVFSSVGLYKLLVHIESRRGWRSYAVGSFVLLYNPWLKEDPVYMPQDAQLQEYIKSDYGLVYMGTNVNVGERPWSFGQYEPGVLEACLQLLDVSPQHLDDQDQDIVRRADPVYLSRVVCSMVNCNDDLGILMGKWQGSYEGGVNPTEWSGSADILHRWVSSKFKPVRFGQCWVFASVLCTVMRVLGIPSRVVTVFNAAHDCNANMKIEEFYSSTGEKLNLSKDSIWNFHVWVESWMRRPDLGERFDGWQVVDPTPQEKSAGVFVCGPCPVAAVQQKVFGAEYDTPFIYASVDADVVRLIVRQGMVVGRKVDPRGVGQLIYTKSVDSDDPENLTDTYKLRRPMAMMMCSRSAGPMAMMMCSRSAGEVSGREDSNAVHEGEDEDSTSVLDVSLKIEGKPTVGQSIRLCINIKNNTFNKKVLMEHVNAQIKEYNSGPQESFWKVHQEVHMGPSEVLTLRHTIPPSEYESFLSSNDIVNVAVVMKDMMTEERVLETLEFNMTSPKITIEVEGGDSIQVRMEHTARVSFTNIFTKALNGAVLTVEGSGLLKDKQVERLTCLKPGGKIEKTVSFTANSTGTKVLMSTFSHGGSPTVVSRGFHKVKVTAAS
ncbi:protein-glutamine gamma-glutamyltransferase 5-like isoform X1 [Solea solea]|uniref:protein-glutamine gamma-glutamyltransferase 5-like isoform X1 n=1 Tax=Solea solea TaxID=90069 RepID=UPI0027296D59|nr:protein-glutamine gamma-glutamyltransferase 5-like isoform X1 [Solea solea]